MTYAIVLLVILVLCIGAYLLGHNDVAPFKKQVEIKSKHVSNVWEAYNMQLTAYRELRNEVRKASEKCTCGAFSSADFARRLYEKYTRPSEKRDVPRDGGKSDAGTST